jgi:hypothetical protein
MFAVLGGPAEATPITETLDVSLSDFINTFGTAPPPFPTLTGSFTISLDTAVSVENSSMGLTVNSLSFSSDSPVVFGYFAPTGQLSIGGLAGNSNTVFLGTNDFVVQIDLSDPTMPTLYNCAQGFSCGTGNGNAALTASAYASTSSPGIWFAQTGSVTLVPEAVPEPASLGLLGISIGGLLLAKRRNRGRNSVPVRAL